MMTKKELIIYIIIMLVVGVLWIRWTNKLNEARNKAFENCRPLLDENNKIQCYDTRN